MEDGDTHGLLREWTRKGLSATALVRLKYALAARAQTRKGVVSDGVNETTVKQKHTPWECTEA
jgi:hypothetical protein